VFVTASAINGMTSILLHDARKRVCHVITERGNRRWKRKKGFKVLFMIGNLRFSQKKQIFLAIEDKILFKI
jgi:hypothetical protein